MSRTKININVSIPVQFQLPGMPDDERETASPTLKIVYRYLTGSPAVMYQRNGDPGWPAEPTELDFISAELMDGDGLAPTQEQVDQWAKDWLDGDGYGEACEHAEDMLHPDPDDERDRRRDDALMDR